MTALSALAKATIVAPADGVVPAALEATVRHACAGAWRAIEIVLAGDVLRGRLGKTRDAVVRDAVEAVLGLFASVPVRPDAVAGLRRARESGVLDRGLELGAIVANVHIEGAAAASRSAILAVRRDLAEYRELEAALAEPDLAGLLVDAARALFRSAARAPELARWAIGPTGVAARDRALAAFAELVDSPASLDELDALIALPIHLDENVQFTVYRPRTIDPGRWHPLLAFAHLSERRPDDDAPDPVEEVRRQAAAALGDRVMGYQPVMQDSGSAIPAEGELTFVPEMAGVEFNPPRRSFLWLEAVHREEFRMRAGPELDGKTVRGRLTVFLGHIAIAEVALSVRIDQKRPEPAPREPAHARTYRRIFASYSHRDVAIVNQFETYARALGDEYLRDWIHLRTGEVWNDRLRQLIEQADAFQLFWSWNAIGSKFVRQEYEHALALNRPSFVRPTYWEEPMPTAPGLPPDALLRLHFQKIGAAMLPLDPAPRRSRATDPQPEPALSPLRREEPIRSPSKPPALFDEHEPTDPQAEEAGPSKQARARAGVVDYEREHERSDHDHSDHERSIDTLDDEAPAAEFENRVTAEIDPRARPAPPPRPTEAAPTPSPALAVPPPAAGRSRRDDGPTRPAPARPATQPPPALQRPPSPRSAEPSPPPAPSPAPAQPAISQPRPAAAKGAAANFFAGGSGGRAMAGGAAADDRAAPPSSPMAGERAFEPPPKIPTTLSKSPPPMPDKVPGPVVRPSPVALAPPDVATDAKAAPDAGDTLLAPQLPEVVAPRPSRPDVSPFAATVEQRAYEDPFGATNANAGSKVAPTPEAVRPPEANTGRGLVLALVLVVLVVAAVIVIMLLTQ